MINHHFFKSKSVHFLVHTLHFSTAHFYFITARIVVNCTLKYAMPNLIFITDGGQVLATSILPFEARAEWMDTNFNEVCNYYERFSPFELHDYYISVTN